MGNNFSKSAKATSQQNNGGDSDYAASDAWKRYQFEVFKAKVQELNNGKHRKEKTIACVVNLIVDLGTPAGVVDTYKTKCELPIEGETYSQEEIDFMEKKKGTDFIWDKDWDATADNGRGGKGAMVTVRKQTRIANPTQEYGFAVDVPSVLIDFSQHPKSTSTEPDMRPLRISLNGWSNYSKSFQKIIKFQMGWNDTEIHENNYVRKIAKAAEIESELAKQWDIGEMAQAVCNFKVRMDLQDNEKGVFLDIEALSPSVIEDTEDEDGEVVVSAERKREKALQCETLAPFTGILLQGMEYSDDALKMIGSDHFRFIQRAETSRRLVVREGVSAKTGKEYSIEEGFDYEGCDFQKAYEKWKSAKASEKPQSGGESKPKQTPVQKDKPAEKAPERVVTPQEPEGEEFDEFDEIPF